MWRNVRFASQSSTFTPSRYRKWPVERVRRSSTLHGELLLSYAQHRSPSPRFFLSSSTCLCSIAPSPHFLPALLFPPSQVSSNGARSGYLPLSFPTHGIKTRQASLLSLGFPNIQHFSSLPLLRLHAVCANGLLLPTLPHARCVDRHFNRALPSIVL